MIKRLWAKLVRAGLRQYTEEMERVNHPDAPRVASSNMERLFGDCQPALVAFQIENGYVMRCLQTGPYHDGQASGFTYCKDHTAIAEHIITEAAKRRLDLDPSAKKDAIMKQQSLQYGGSVSTGRISAAQLNPSPVYAKNP